MNTSHPLCSLFRIILSSLALLMFSQISIASSAERKALIIGNSSYSALAPLRNPGNDASSIADALESLNFEVDLYIDATYDDMERALEVFAAKLTPDTISVVYYAGHGIQHEGVNYLIPANADIEQSWQLKSQTLSLNSILDALNSSRSELKIVMLDACRDNPLRSQSGLPRSLRTQGGLATASSTSGTVMSYATAPNDIAYDGDENSKHSPYTQALLNHLSTPEISVVEMLNRVGNEVNRITDGRQIPWQNVSPIRDFCFGGCRNQSTDALARELTSISEAFERENFRQLKDQLALNTEQSERLFTLFQTYDQISVSDASIQRARSDRYANATLVINGAITEDGKKVTPAPSWASMDLLLRSDADQWQVTELTNSYLQPQAGRSDADIFPPNVLIKKDDISATANNEIMLAAEAADNDAVDQVRLFYRVRGSNTTFRSTLLSKNGTPDFYTGKINLGGLVGDELEVYVEATDLTGNKTQSPSSDMPMTINIVHGGSGVVTNKPSRKWWYVGLGILAVGVAASLSGGSDSRSGGTTDGSTTDGTTGGTTGGITVTITTPIP